MAIIKSQAYFEDLLSAEVLKRPKTLAKVEVVPSHEYCNEESKPKDFIEQFQSLLERECAKEEFLENARSIQGLQIKAKFIKGKVEVWLFSKTEHPSDQWIDVSFDGRCYGSSR